MCRKRHIAALPLRAAPPLPSRAGEPTEKSLYHFLKNLGVGSFKRIYKGTFSGGARAGLPAQAAGLHFSISLGNRCEPRRRVVPRSEGSMSMEPFVLAGG